MRTLIFALFVLVFVFSANAYASVDDLRGIWVASWRGIGESHLVIENVTQKTVDVLYIWSDKYGNGQVKRSAKITNLSPIRFEWGDGKTDAQFTFELVTPGVLKAIRYKGRQGGMTVFLKSGSGYQIPESFSLKNEIPLPPAVKIFPSLSMFSAYLGMWRGELSNGLKVMVVVPKINGDVVTDAVYAHAEHPKGLFGPGFRLVNGVFSNGQLILTWSTDNKKVTTVTCQLENGQMSIKWQKNDQVLEGKLTKLLNESELVSPSE